jgi:hypothetical protein
VTWPVSSGAFRRNRITRLLPVAVDAKPQLRLMKTAGTIDEPRRWKCVNRVRAGRQQR